MDISLITKLFRFLTGLETWLVLMTIWCYRQALSLRKEKESKLFYRKIKGKDISNSSQCFYPIFKNDTRHQNQTNILFLSILCVFFSLIMCCCIQGTCHRLENIPKNTNESWHDYFIQSLSPFQRYPTSFLKKTRDF